MKFIRPTIITAAMLTSADVPETAPAAWNAGTTYAAADQCSTGTAGGVITVWVSQQAGNLAHDPTTDDGTWWVEVNTTYAEWNSGTTYALGEKVISATTHRVYESLQGTNLNHALTDTAWWLDVGPTNRWGLFDEKVGTVTTQAESATYVLQPGRLNSLALLEINAATVDVALVVSGETVYSAHFDVADIGNNVGNWYEYFYEPIYSQDSLTITDLVDAALLDVPAYGEGVLTVTIARPGGTVSVGMLVVGLVTEIGTLKYDPTVSIRDFSRKEADQWGNYTLVQRDYSKQIKGELIVMSSDVDRVTRELSRHRAMNVVWIGSPVYGSLVVFGFLSDWRVTIEGPVVSSLAIEIEGMT